MSDLDLRDLDAFVAVARTRNFRRAALEQRVSVSSLSQRLRELEERLGVRLMNRTTRSVGLTEAGELLLARVGPAMSDVGDALDHVRGLRGVPSGRLRINAPPPAIDLVLAPMAAPFLRPIHGSISRLSATVPLSISSPPASMRACAMASIWRRT
jgi:DNA-binding transcriptional LysR family regulator